MAKNTFTVNIATYNQKKNLELILEALKMQTFKDFEVIVCDDGSSDGTKEAMEKLDIKYFFQEHDGFRLAKSKNNGVKVADSVFFVSLEADVIPHPTLLEEYLKVMDEGTVALGIRDDIAMLPERLDFNLLDKYIVSRDFRLPVLSGDFNGVDKPWRLCSGCNVCFPTEKLQSIGGWNESFHKYGVDDYEVCLRMVMAGCKIVPAINCRGYHLRHDIHPTTQENWDILESLERKFYASCY